MPLPSYKLDSFNFEKQSNLLYIKDGENYILVEKADLNPYSKNSSYLTSFGENSVAVNYPFIQTAPVQNFLPANFREYNSNGGAGVVENREFKVNTGTGVGGYGAIQSFRSLNYKAGSGGLGRFTARFENGGVANSWQGVGFINLGDELSFGYNGENFGIWHRQYGEPHIAKLNIGTPAGGNENVTVNINSVEYVIPITSGTSQKNAHEIASYLSTGASAFSSWQNDNNVYISYLSDGAKTGTYSFSSAGAAVATWTTITTGVTKTSNFIPQQDWNIDTKTGLDPTKGNVYQINYQYLGYGGIRFSVENPDTAQFEPVHLIKYANANTRPSLLNPSLHLGLYCVSLGSTEDISVYSASMSAFTQGEVVPTRNRRSKSVTKSLTSSLTNMLTIRNKVAVNGTSNQAEIEPVYLTFFTESNKGATVEIRTGATLGGTPNFQEVGNENLISEYDTSGTTVSGGVVLDTFVFSANTSFPIDLSAYKIRVPPSLQITVAARVNSGAASDSAASLSWYEDV